jgi:hypothetical protein
MEAAFFPVPPHIGQRLPDIVQSSVDAGQFFNELALSPGLAADMPVEEPGGGIYSGDWRH